MAKANRPQVILLRINPLIKQIDPASPFGRSIDNPTGLVLRQRLALFAKREPLEINIEKAVPLLTALIDRCATPPIAICSLD